MVTKTQRTKLAKCYVAIAEIDHDLRAWRAEIDQVATNVDHHWHVWEWLRHAR